MVNSSLCNSSVVLRAVYISSVLYLAILGMPAAALGQAVLNPNQIAGQLAFANESAEVRAVLDEETRYRYFYVSADSVGLERTLRNYAFNSYTNQPAVNYDLTVESASSGIIYDVGAEASFGKSSRFRYKFQAVRSGLVTPEPAPDVEVNLGECTSLVQINFVDRAGKPALIDDGRAIAWEAIRTDYGSYYLSWHAINYYLATAGQSSFDYLPVRGDGTTFRLDVTYRRGTDPYSNQVSYTCTQYVTGSCDQVVQTTCVVPDAIDLGSITGTLDMVGEEEKPNYALSMMRAWDGPQENFRYQVLGLKPASGPFSLSRLLPSVTDLTRPGYLVYGEMLIREGRRVEYFQTPVLGYQWTDRVRVNPGEATDLGDTFVIRPGIVKGKIELAGPEPEEAASCLAYLYRDSDQVDANGVPYNYFVSRSYVGAYGSYYSSSGLGGTGGAARVEYEGAYDPLTGAFRGDYELVLGGLKGGESYWTPNQFSAVFSRDGYINSTSDKMLYSSFQLYDNRIGEKLIRPGKDEQVDRAYCLSEVKITYKSLGSNFYLPEARVTGEFSGTDFQGREGSYQVNYGQSYGYPTSISKAARDGVVTLCLPQGSYEITPSVNSVSTNGSSMKTELKAIKLDVGCAQRIEVTTELQLSLGRLPAETQDLLTVYGAAHSTLNLASVEYALNDEAPQTICTNCGADPRFSFEPKLRSGENKLTVTARDIAGATAVVTARLNYRPRVTVANCADVVGLPDEPIAFDLHALGGCGGDLELNCDHESGISYPAGVTTVRCTASDACGTTEACEFDIKVPTDDDERACALGKVVLCHIPPGNVNAAHSIRIGLSAVAAHLQHGDTLGACPGDSAESIQDDGRNERSKCRTDGMEVCHLPPGNQGNGQTLSIGWNAVRAHLEHGDVLGSCDADEDSRDGGGASSSSSSTSGDDTSRWTRDSDGDGRSDGAEERDGTNPTDRGSFRTSLVSPVYALWNRALDMLNILELVNPGSAEVAVRLTLYGFNGEALYAVNLPIGAFGERDVIVNDLPGFKQSPYGLVKIEFENPIDGRMFYYRRTDASAYDYAFNAPLENASTGRTAVTFNTFQPSAKAAEQEHVVMNWLSLVNLQGTGRRFTVKSYRQSGELFLTRAVYVPAFGRADVDGGHAAAGAGVVGLHEVIPEDNLPYIMHLMRYGSNARPGEAASKFDFAFALTGRPGNGSKVVAPLSRKFGEDNWLELANTAAEPIEVELKLYAEDGRESHSSTIVLGAYAQQHLSPAVLGALEAGESGTALIRPSRINSLAAQSMFYFRKEDGGIAAMYGSQAGEPVAGPALSGSYNRFLGMENWLKIFNSSPDAAVVTVRVNGGGAAFEGQVEVAGHGTVNLPLHDGVRFGTRTDTYGVVGVSAAAGAEFFSEVVRIRPAGQGAGVDFASATRTR